MATGVLEREGAVPPGESSPLENGDRLTRPEFERRYAAMPQLKKAELLEGVVYVPSPASFKKHGQPQIAIAGWLAWYQAHTPGVASADNATVRLDFDNEPQPDALLLIAPELGGQARIDEDDFVSGAPELVAEIASSSASYDLHVKRDVYRRSGVREYVVWRVRDQAIDWLVLCDGRYEPLEPGPDGILRSTVFPGLWLDPQALLANDLKRALQVAAQGVSSPEHAAFVARLQAPAG